MRIYIYMYTYICIYIYIYTLDRIMHHIESYRSHGNTLQHTATHYTTLQRTATHCNTLQICTPSPISCTTCACQVSLFVSVLRLSLSVLYMPCMIANAAARKSLFFVVLSFIVAHKRRSVWYAYSDHAQYSTVRPCFLN